MPISISKKGGLLFCLILSILISLGQPRTKVACIGNSVTFGYDLGNPRLDSYPGQLQSLLGQRFEVRNFGHSGATLLRKGHRPILKQRNTRRPWILNPMLPLYIWESMIPIRETGQIINTPLHQITRI